MSILIIQSNQSKYQKTKAWKLPYISLSKIDINSTREATLCKRTLKRPVLGTATAGFFPLHENFFSFEAIPILILERILYNKAQRDILFVSAKVYNLICNTHIIQFLQPNK
jgi:hypothetical protein